MSGQPHASRPGRLKNGNPSGNPHLAPRCGARTRAGSACRAPAMANGRCHKHGGASTGARTDEGRQRARRARLRHGMRSQAAAAQRQDIRAILHDVRATIGACKMLLLPSRRGDDG